MSVVFNGTVGVHYRQIYVISDDDRFIDGFERSTDGQANGLCGAATPGLLYLITGLHTGDVGFTVEVHDARPPVPGGWEDVVEASFRPLTAGVSLCQWAAEERWPLPLDVADYRVRYCATGMDEGAGEPDTDDIVDRYLLQFWPAAPAPDEILRQGSEHAAYWHSTT